MSAGRLVSVLILLQLRGRLTAEELARETGVSARTIYRDLDALGTAGVPVYADPGPGGGFQLVDGYRTRLTGLDAEEARSLLVMGLPGPAAALGLGPAAARARGKVLASLPAALGEPAGRMATRLYLDPVEWYRVAEPVVHLPELARAVIEQRRVAMRYESWTATRERTVEPLGLVLKAGAWYVVAREAGAARTFRVSKVLALATHETSFERPAGFDLAAYWAAALERFESGLRPGRARLRATSRGLERLSRLGAYAARAVKEAPRPTRDGMTEVVLPVESIEQAALTILGLGPEVVVLEPAALRRRLRELARAIARAYSRTTA